jgi:hypothetical protein
MVFGRDILFLTFLSAGLARLIARSYEHATLRPAQVVVRAEAHPSQFNALGKL